jgi:ABC-type sugar transport system ATPase subunit
MLEKILEMRSITKRFPGVLALDKVSFDVYAGEILALCGENGAGKSTLMKVLGANFPQASYEGEIWVNGKRQKFSRPIDSENAGIAMIYQEISMHLDCSVAENLFLGHLFTKTGGFIIDWKRTYRETGVCLDRIGLTSVDPKTKLKQLSTSQQQLISIARALSKNPRILILDEPTSPLTLRESDYLFKILGQLKSEGISCVLISHKMDEVFENADRITVLRDGRTVATYPRSAATRDRVVADMVGRSIETYYPKRPVPIGNIALRAEHITVSHPYIRNKDIIRDVSIKVREGEILGLAGLVGAGRSELVNAIFGSFYRKSGDIYVRENLVKINNPKHAIRNGIVLITEDRKANGIISMLNIQENVSLASLRQFSRAGILNLKKEAAGVKTISSRLSIKAPSIKTRLGSLSGGNQQKVVLGKWLMRTPSILIMDEPTRGIDVGAKYEIYKIMIELASQGIAIIMISSELPELISMSDRIVVIAEGRVRGEMPAAEATQDLIMRMATDTGFPL